eukprot:m.14067 g.14067  ORF g.14067 m.14067 type:complete len:58 (-) comp4976_c0_seq1:1397-1570(-)
MQTVQCFLVSIMDHLCTVSLRVFLLVTSPVLERDSLWQHHLVDFDDNLNIYTVVNNR